MNSRTIIAGYIMYYMNPYLLFLLFLKLFKNNVYTVYFDDRAAISRFEKRMKDANSYTLLSWKNMNGREYPQGFYFGTTFVVYIQGTTTDNVSATIVAKEAVYASLMSPPEPKKFEMMETETVSSSIDVYIQKGTFKNLYYGRVKLDLAHLTPVPSQRVVLDGILQVYRNLGRATIFISGVTGAGKSSVGYLAAKELRGKYCHTFNPCEPGNQLVSLLCDADTDATSPLVVVLEEVDCLIRRLLSGEVSSNNEVPTLVHNKSTWVSFLDDMFLFKNVLLILTSNTPKDDLDAMDAALLRPGRIHASYCMNEALVI